MVSLGSDSVISLPIARGRYDVAPSGSTTAHPRVRVSDFRNRIETARGRKGERRKEGSPATTVQSLVTGDTNQLLLPALLQVYYTHEETFGQFCVAKGVSVAGAGLLWRAYEHLTVNK